MWSLSGTYSSLVRQGGAAALPKGQHDAAVDVARRLRLQPRPLRVPARRRGASSLFSVGPGWMAGCSSPCLSACVPMRGSQCAHCESGSQPLAKARTLSSVSSRAQGRGPLSKALVCSKPSDLRGWMRKLQWPHHGCGSHADSVRPRCPCARPLQVRLGPKHGLRFVVTLFNGWTSIPNWGTGGIESYAHPSATLHADAPFSLFCTKPSRRLPRTRVLVWDPSAGPSASDACAHL